MVRMNGVHESNCRKIHELTGPQRHTCIMSLMNDHPLPVASSQGPADTTDSGLDAARAIANNPEVVAQVILYRRTIDAFAMFEYIGILRKGGSQEPLSKNKTAETAHKHKDFVSAADIFNALPEDQREAGTHREIPDSAIRESPCSCARFGWYLDTTLPPKTSLRASTSVLFRGRVRQVRILAKTPYIAPLRGLTLDI